VLYYGVISEITPPVCTSAYAAAAIAGSNPFKTGVSAFTFGIGKLLVPMVFVYSPAMLIVLDDYFTWASFLETTITCALGVAMMATAISGYFIAPMPLYFRWLMALAAIFMVAPGYPSDFYAVVMMTPIMLQQFIARRNERAAVPVSV
jgi:TRAP-type uncharacterized transport system fused permease subunit